MTACFAHVSPVFQRNTLMLLMFQVFRGCLTWACAHRRACSHEAVVHQQGLAFILSCTRQPPKHLKHQ